ncbi:MAG TPA: HAD family acid phosphatase [Xanthobacteraceae bacterium]|nr:HAD family acid phosphatase [Xanthobacteraceae bacterium]
MTSHRPLTAGDGTRCGLRVTWAALLAALMLLPALPAAGAECPGKPYRETADAAAPPNLGLLKRRLINYKCFGGYDRDVARVLARAQRHVERRAPRVKQPALVLDVDETALSNWRQMLANDFGYIIEGPCDMQPGFACGVRAWERLAQAEPIKPTLALFNAAKRKGVAIFFITGRTDGVQERAALETNLRGAGYEGWTELIMRPPGFNASSAADFKAAERAKIERRGFRIIANVGDQWSDLRGGHAERRFRVPNPFYFIP